MTNKFFVKMINNNTSLCVGDVINFEILVKSYFEEVKSINVIWGYNTDTKIIFIGKTSKKVTLEPNSEKIVSFSAFANEAGFVRLPKVKIQDKAQSQNGYVASSSHVEFINGLNVVEGTPREKYFFNKSIEPYNCNMYKEVSENDIYYSNQEDE